MRYLKSILPIFALFTVLLTACDLDTPFVPDETQVFIKFFGSLDNDEGVKVAEVEGYGYLLLGTTGSSGIIAGETVFSSVKLIMTDYTGETLWEHVISGNGNFKAGSIAVGETGEIFITGTAPEENSFHTDLFVAQISLQGEQLWIKTFNKPNISETSIEMTYTSDNALVIIGNADAGSGDALTTGTQDFYVLKADIAGEVIWERTYGFEEGKTDYGNALVETVNGDFIWIGTTQKDNQTTQGLNSDMRVVRSNELGNLIWDYLFGGDGNDFGNKAIMQNNEYLLVGAKGSATTNNSNIYLVKIDNNGQELWSAEYGGESDENAFDIYGTNDGGLIMAGYTFSYGNGKSDIFLVKTDPAGNLQWQSVIGGQGDDEAKSVVQTSDGGFLVTGTIQFENNTMISLIKTNTLGTTTFVESRK
jgi:hypothetical protein